MKYSESEVGMAVRDTRTGRGYVITGARIHATDRGAWVRSLHNNEDDVRETGVIHWEYLEPLKPEDWITVRLHASSGWRLECAEEIQGNRVRGGKWWRITRDGVLRDGPAGDGVNSLHNYQRFVTAWLEDNYPELAAWLKSKNEKKGN